MAFAFSAAIGQLLFALLMLLFSPGGGQHGTGGIVLSLPCFVFAAMSCAIVVRQRLSRWFIVAGVAAGLQAFTVLHLDFWLACTAGLVASLPLLFLPGMEWRAVSRAPIVHHLHNLQQLTILCGMGLSLWHAPLRLPVLLSIFGGMAQWNRHLVGACPFTLLEARLTVDRVKAGELEKQGYFLYYLRHWTGWPITRRQLATVITVLIASMLGQWLLA